ncbi:Rrf2 family transcriptional regulator [Pedobacter cryoconitis]|uniref:Rrf2 family transcriptional regulator n=1 Tax=Pedobacter cryoconitis TaxID=188932 RepID=UPI00161A8F4D|nr:Rrf2 family transcriptional regulator [Pedobacter cryoconitis]MBB5645874.1 Rrf2 family protein [Pedobacter cryoconitis]
MNNVQFATAIHILTLLASEGTLSSTDIAGSININAAMVRKSLSVLSKEGLVETREGKGGGASLAKPANLILLSDIYKAVNTAPLLGKTNHPDPGCKIGKQINSHLVELYSQADNAIINRLSSMTLAGFCKKFK